MSRHAEFAAATDVPVSFCNAYSPWQRGSNENTNGLLRQYLPKNTDLSIHAPEQLDTVISQINNRPRAALNWQTPTEVYNAASSALIAGDHRRYGVRFRLSLKASVRGGLELRDAASGTVRHSPVTSGFAGL